jgi:hypothetical protein
VLPELDGALADAAGVPTDAAPGVDAAQATQVTDYCQELPALPAEPVIDGRVDAALRVLDLVPVGWTAKDGSTSAPSHTTASYALAWRPSGIYVYLRVIDPNRLPFLDDGVNYWKGDSVELYADSDGVYAAAPNYDDPGTMQIVVAAPSDDTTASTDSARFRNAVSVGAWTSSKFAALPTPDGYVFEGLIEADALNLTSWALAAGGQVGIDLGINVSALDDQLDAGITLDGYRLGQYFLHVGGADCGGLPFCTPAAFCTPTLIE